MKGVIRGGENGKPFVYLLDGVEVTKEAFDLAIPSTRAAAAGQALTGWKTIVSESMAVHPRQIPQVLARNARHGLKVNYDHHGRPHLETREQKRRLMKIEGFHDNDGGYGDDPK